MILDDIAAKTRMRVARSREQRPLGQLREQVLALAPASALPPAPALALAPASVPPPAPPPTPTPGERFMQALARPQLSFICEVKRASPSAGLIAEDFDHLAIMRAYEQAGADALSVLTEPDFFQGADSYLADIAQQTVLPTLRKDFIIDEYQLYEARLLGAAAVLLIVALLDDDQLRAFAARAAELGLATLVEAHTAAEVARAVAAGAPIIGINNRDLTSFTVDLATTERLRAQIPAGTLVVAESGIRMPTDAARMRAAGADAVLIGEALMRERDVTTALARFRQAAAAGEGDPQ